MYDVYVQGDITIYGNFDYMKYLYVCNGINCPHMGLGYGYTERFLQLLLPSDWSRAIVDKFDIGI